MLSLFTPPAIDAALRLLLEPHLRRLLTDRIDHYRAAGLLDLTHIVVIEPGDTEHNIIEAIGFSPLVNPMDGARYGSAVFHPYWDGPLWRHDGWFELIVTVGNSGFAFVLLIADADGVPLALLDLCRAHASA